ncbi:MAG: hypothetical protein ACKVZJ_14880 [Phycisphaerales bacterium]
MNAVQKLRQMVTEIRHPKNPMKVLDSWDLVRGLLSRLPVDQAAAKQACDKRDADAYEALVAQLEALDAQQRGKAPAPAPAAAAPVSPEMAHQMDAALRAFRKRLKVTRLADESSLAGRRLTSGKKSKVDAMLPPHEFPDEVWRALAAAGKLTHTGQGFYALVDDKGGSNAHEDLVEP